MKTLILSVFLAVLSGCSTYTYVDHGVKDVKAGYKLIYEGKKVVAIMTIATHKSGLSCNGYMKLSDRKLKTDCNK